MTDPRPILVLGTAASAAALLVAFAAQHLGGLAPCPLCLWQRWPYAIAIAVGLLALVVLPAHRLRLAAGALGLLFLAGGGIAFFHVGVEAGWWQGLAECSGAATLGAQSIDDLRKALMETAPVRCDAVPWSLFGLSIAGYNLIASAVLAVVAFAATLAPRRA